MTPRRRRAPEQPTPCTKRSQSCDWPGSALPGTSKGAGEFPFMSSAAITSIAKPAHVAVAPSFGRVPGRWPPIVHHQWSRLQPEPTPTRTTTVHLCGHSRFHSRRCLFLSPFLPQLSLPRLRPVKWVWDDRARENLRSPLLPAGRLARAAPSSVAASYHTLQLARLASSFVPVRLAGATRICLGGPLAQRTPCRYFPEARWRWPSLACSRTTRYSQGPSASIIP